jgi:D-arabinose 1-dehydrogenase-like Zn-dependent alcohol dehydrogenase
LKAAVIEKFGSLSVREVPEPEPGEYEALCQLLYGATCTGTDLHIIDGTFPWIGRLPTVPGHESVGRVIALGTKVRHFRIGDIVTRVGMPAAADGSLTVTWGGYAEFGLAKDHWAMCADGLPESEWKSSRWNQVVQAGIDPRTAPMFTTWRETLSVLLRMGVGAGASVLVVGSGGNGLAFSRHSILLQAAEVTMLGAAYSEERGRQVGVNHFVDYRSEHVTKALQEIQLRGFDFIIDSVGKREIADQILPCLRPGGRYATYGLDDYGKLALNPSRAPGVVCFDPCRYDEAETHQMVSEWVMQGKLKAEPWYDLERPWPLDGIDDAFQGLRQRKSPKVLIRLSRADS